MKGENIHMNSKGIVAIKDETICMKCLKNKATHIYITLHIEVMVVLLMIWTQNFSVVMNAIDQNMTNGSMKRK